MRPFILAIIFLSFSFSLKSVFAETTTVTNNDVELSWNSLKENIDRFISISNKLKDELITRKHLSKENLKQYISKYERLSVNINNDLSRNGLQKHQSNDSSGQTYKDPKKNTTQKKDAIRNYDNESNSSSLKGNTTLSNNSIANFPQENIKPKKYNLNRLPRNRFALFLNGKWRVSGISESGMGIISPYDIIFRVDNEGRMKAYYLRKTTLDACPPESSIYPELAALCRDKSIVEQMNIKGWQFDGRRFVFESSQFDIVEHFELYVESNQKMVGRTYNFTPSMPGTGRTMNRYILMLKVGN